MVYKPDLKNFIFSHSFQSTLAGEYSSVLIPGKHIVLMQHLDSTFALIHSARLARSHRRFAVPTVPNQARLASEFMPNITQNQHFILLVFHTLSSQCFVWMLWIWRYISLKAS